MSQTQSENGVATPSAEEDDLTDLERDQTLYDLEFLGNLGSSDYEVYFGGFNLVRIYNAEGEGFVMTVEEFEEFAEEVNEEATNQRFREMFGGAE